MQSVTHAHRKLTYLSAIFLGIVTWYFDVIVAMAIYPYFNKDQILATSFQDTLNCSAGDLFSPAQLADCF
jgi:hypothetical protein